MKTGSQAVGVEAWWPQSGSLEGSGRVYTDGDEATRIFGKGDSTAH